MKRILLLVALLVVIVSSATSQKPGSGIGPGLLWSRYTVKDEEFSVTLPMHPAMATSEAPRKGDGKRRVERRLKISSGDTTYSIEAFENPKPRQSVEEFITEQGLDAAFDSATKRKLIIDGFAGVEYLSSNNATLAVVQIFSTAKHLYRFSASGPGAGASAPLKQFFSSIKLGKDPDGIEISDGPGASFQTGARADIYTGKNVDTKPRLLTKPEPAYTKDGRNNEISGVVILKVVFAKTGEVNNIRVVQGLPFGLTEQAINAARKIKFIPAMKDGKPVSMWMQLEYYFNL